MADNVFSHLMTAPAAPTQMGSPLQGPSGNDRVIAPADPYKQANEARAAEDQRMQRERDARQAKKDAQPNLPAGYQIGPDGKTAVRIAGLPPEKNADGAATEAERKAAAFLIRALGSNDSYEAVDIDKNTPGVQGIGPRSMVGQTLADKAPNVLNSLPGSIGNSPERQVADTNQNEFIAATLRQDSGAAIPPEEMENQRRIYFPMPGDGPDVIASKKQARLRAIEGLKQSAGRMSEEAIQRFQGMDGQNGITGTVTDDRPNTPPAAVPPTNPPAGGGADPRDPSGLSGLGALAKQGVSLGLSDEAAGIGGYLSGFMTGEDPNKAYARERDTERAFLAKARSEWPIIGTAAEFLGGGGAAKVAEAPATLASIARQGAGIGAVGGFGYGEGANSVPGAVVGAAGGAALGAGLYGAGRSLSALMPKRPVPNMEIVAAGERQNIPIRQPDARPELRGQYAAAESTQSGGPLVREARTADAAAIEARAGEIGGGKAYTQADNTAVGQTAQRIAERGNENVREAASQLYKRVERSAPDFKMPGAQTTAFIDQKIADLKAMSPTGYKAEIDALESMKSDIAQTGLSVGTLQAQRMTVGGRIGDNIADRTRADATLSSVLKVAGEELHSGLAGVNPGAAAALKRADAKWGQYKNLQREVTGLFLGKRDDATAETAARSLGAMVNGKGNYEALRRFMTLATPEEKADFATTFALEWGRTGRGRGEFSPAAFAKNLSDQSDRTLNALFGPEGRAALRDLQAISNVKTDALSRQAPSGVAVSNMGNGLKRLLWGALGLAGGGPTGAIAGGAAQGIVAKLGEERAARLLLNPNFTKWVRNAPNTNNPKVIDRYFSRLAGSIAANDNQAFVSALRSSVGQSPGSVAASTEQENETRRVPPQQ